MEDRLGKWVLWFVVRIDNPASVTSVAACMEQSGDKMLAVFPVSTSNRERHCVTAV